MATCLICEAIRSENIKKIFEEEDIIVMLHPSPAVEGHIVVVPKKHFSILEQMPNEIAQKAFLAANKFSVALFDVFKAMGTNIIAANGLPAGQTWPHFSINIIPRRENDGLNFQWTPKQASDESLAVIAGNLEVEINKIIYEQGKEIAESAGEETAKEEEKPVVKPLPTESYLMRQLRRLP